MSRGDGVSDDATSRRTEGPTPAGGAYAVAYFSHDGTPVPQRFANQVLIVEYDDHGSEIMRTLGTTTPEAVLPPDYVPDPAAPSPPEGMDLFALGAGLGRVRLSPRERSVADGPPLATQAVCLARAYVVEAPWRASYSLAIRRAAELLAGRDVEGRWIVSRFGDRVSYIQLRSDGAGRTAAQLPAGVDEHDVIEHDLGPDVRQATDQLREVCERLAAETPGEEDEFALRLARGALGCEETAAGLWEDLRERARGFVRYFERHPVSSIPADLTREALAGVRADFEQGREYLLLDVLLPAAARVLESVTSAVVAAERAGGGDADARLRALYHRFNLSLARGPATETPALHLVAAALTASVLEDGFTAEIEGLAQRELHEADELVAGALDLPDDLDGFYWLLFAAALPLQAANILYRVLAAADDATPVHARLANLSEEKLVRVTSSVIEDAHGLYTPLLVDARQRVQEKLRAEGSLRARQEAIDVIDHSLSFPRWIEPYLLEENARGEDYWDELMAARRPLRSPFAPVRPGAPAP